MDQAANVRAAGPAGAAQRYAIRFTGSGGEYFRIWIVNLLLTLLTLGIYSAWAKVRKMQYFYRNTQLDGSVFDYHGKPLAILKGRLIALALIVFYNVGLELNIIVGLVAAALFALALPWLLVQSQKFKLYNTSYRGLRFHFTGELREAYLIFGVPVALTLAPLLLISLAARSEQPDTRVFVALGLTYLLLLLLAPYLHWRLKRFQHGGAWYGQARGRLHAGARSFYAIYGIALLLLLGGGALLGLVFGLGVMGTASGLSRGMSAAMLLPVLAVLLVYGLLLAIGPFIMARVQNLVWNRSLLGTVGFDSRVQARRLVWIAISNLLLIVLTLGLYTPFAAVRMYRYRTESVTVLSTTDLAGFAAAQSDAVGATGEGAADLLDLDFAI